MPKLRRVSGEQAVHALEKLGFVQVRQKGSHVVLRRDAPEGTTRYLVPVVRCQRDKSRQFIAWCFE